ncbi:MAG: CNNM domain-containing protein [Phycisphaerales bacterium]|nr:CNNM domain-containing protein [Phycisphaerales bacterium]
MSPADVMLLSIAALVGIVLSALFSGMETGLYTMGRVRLSLRRAEGDRAAQRLGALLDNPARMLATVLLGTNIASALVSSSIAYLLEGTGLSEAWIVVVNTVILVPVIMILCEILPKDLFLVHGDRWCYALASPMTWTRRTLTWIGIVPLVEFVGKLATAAAGGDFRRTALSARQRMSDLLKEGTRSGMLSAEQVGLLDRALELRNRCVSDEMIPFSQVRTIQADADEDSRRASIDSPWTRLPVISEQGKVLGAASVIDMALNPQSSVGDLMQDVMRFEAATTVAAALAHMRRSDATMGIVEREGMPLGLVTAKDLVEALTGELVAW